MLWYNLQISGYTCVSVDGFFEFFASFHMFRGCLINQCAIIRRDEENINMIPTCKAGFLLCFDDVLHASWLYGV